MTLAKKRKTQQSKSTPKTSDETVNEAVTDSEIVAEDAVDDVVAEIEETADISDEKTDESSTDTDEPSADAEAPTEDADETSTSDDEPLPTVEEASANLMAAQGETETPEPDLDDDLNDETVPEHTDSASIAPRHQDSASNSVLLPALLGGLIAAGIGFAVAYYMLPRAEPGLNESVAANSAEVASLKDQIAALPAEAESVDLTPVTEEITSLRDQITADLENVNAQIAAFDERLVTLEKQPSSDGTLQDSALEAYQRELDELRSQVEEQAGAALAQLESTRAEAEAIEQAALDAARAAQVRTALAQVQTSLTDGEPMQAALQDLEDALGEPVPDALTAVAEGAPTLAGLQAAFPDAARAALADARAGGASGEEATAFGAFLREQLNVRSVAPREGDDADAILSRTQAAVREGKLQEALDEIAALPDVAKANLAEWVATAETRLAAVNAADDISLSLNVN